MSTFVDYVNSQEVDKVVIGPPLNKPSTNARLIPNTKATSTWATKQSLGFVKWRVDLNGWVVDGGNVPIEWSEKNVIVGAPKSNLAIGSTKRSRDKSCPSKVKPKKVRHKKASIEKPNTGIPKPPAIVQSDSGAVPTTNFSVPVAASASTLTPLK